MHWNAFNLIWQWSRQLHTAIEKRRKSFLYITWPMWRHGPCQGTAWRPRRALRRNADVSVLTTSTRDPISNIVCINTGSLLLPRTPWFLHRHLPVGTRLGGRATAIDGALHWVRVGATFHYAKSAPIVILAILAHAQLATLMQLIRRFGVQSRGSLNG